MDSDQVDFDESSSGVQRVNPDGDAISHSQEQSGSQGRSSSHTVHAIVERVRTSTQDGEEDPSGEAQENDPSCIDAELAHDESNKAGALALPSNFVVGIHL